MCVFSRPLREPLKIPGSAFECLSTAVSSNRKGKKSEGRDREYSRVRHSGPFISFCHCRVESKRGRIRNVKCCRSALAILAVLAASLALAQSFTTVTLLRLGHAVAAT